MSLGVSPSAGSSFPSPPLAVGSLPRGGGILIHPEDAQRIRRPSEPTSPIIIEPSPMSEKRLSLTIPEESTGLPMSGSGSGSASQRIRFAPLPEPSRPRSLSTGGDPTWSGEHEGSHQTVLVKDVKGYDNALESEDDDDDDEGHKRGRRWSKSMGMGSVDWGSSWKGTKKILTMGLIGDGDEEVYADGAPLKKSVSTGGFIGSSPFRWTAETERKKNMLGTSPNSGPSLLSPSRDSSAHRRNSSLEASGGLISPAKPVKMLNGRVYGGRRASETAQAEKKLREKNEPEFVEWGSGKGGGGMGSNQSSKAAEEEDDGSGMDWVRKRKQRREQQERERLEREAREREAESALEIETGGESDSSQDQRPNPITPSVPQSELPPPPIIHVSEYSTTSDIGPTDMGDRPTNPIGIMAGKRVENRDVFDDDDGDRKRGKQSSDDEDSDEEEEDEEDDGDFSEDEEEEEELRTTSTAAGVEKVSRHREQPREQAQPAAVQV